MTKKKIKLAIVNGPNLNLLGKREPDIYGSRTFEDFLVELKKKHPLLTIDYYQSNVEGELINAIQQFGFSHQGIVLNAAAYTHTSVGIGDAVKAVPSPVIEVHISNTFSRESFRHQSYISPNAAGVILGLGFKGYALAVEALIDMQG